MRKIVLLSLVLLGLPGMAVAEESQTVVSFEGEIVDQSAAPVSGVLPLEFRVYSDSKSKKAILTEQYFVSIVDGAYQVVLGEKGGLPTDAEKLYVAVYLDKKELTRQEVAVRRQVVNVDSHVVQTETVGGNSGKTFELSCPAGYVVTGIEGTTENDGIQGLRLVCSKSI